MQAVLPEIESLGASLAVISPQLEKYSGQVVKKHNLTYPVLCDKSNAVAAQFKIVFELSQELKGIYKKFGIDLERFHGDTQWKLPMPARYIIDQTGKIIDHSVSPDYAERPEPQTIIDILRSNTMLKKI